MEEVARDSKPLTEVEQQVLQALKEHLGPERENELEEEGYIRFIRGYQTEKPRLPKTFEFMDACLAWRKEAGAATLLQRASTEKLPQQDAFLKAYPTIIGGEDKHGHPIACVRIADIDIPTLLKMDLKHVVPLEACKNERILVRKRDCREKYGKMIYQHVAIVDVTGLGASVLYNRAILQSIAHVGNNYYPETAYVIIMVNCSMGLRMLWSTIKMFLHPLTAAKVQMLGSSYLKEIGKFGIEVDQLPTQFGGTFPHNYMHTNADGSSWP